MERTGPFEPEQPIREKLRHFDILAGVDLLGFDLVTSGEVQPETWHRVYDEELCYVAEGLNRPLKNEFILKQQNGSLVYFSEGAWRPYIGLLENGLAAANNEVAKDFRKKLLVDMAERDLLLGMSMQSMEPGQTISWYSSYPYREAEMYGEDLMTGLGFQPARKMGFLHQAQKNLDGSVVLASQSVDSSDEEAFEAAASAAEDGQDIEGMLGAYDEVLRKKTGNNYIAGRELADGDVEQNAWEIVQKHRDLVDYYFDELLVLAKASSLSRDQLKFSKKKLTYGFWAAIKERSDNEAGASPLRVVNIPAYAPIQQEIETAYHRLKIRGEIMFGCGGIIDPNDPSNPDILQNISSQEVYDLIFGEDADKINDKSKDKAKLKCVNCPECGTFHDEVKKVGGRYRCKNTECSLH